MTLERSLPEIDGYARTYWNAAAQGKLLVQRCLRCNTHQHYARPFCLACGGRDLQWQAACGKGRVWSFTTVYRGPYDDLPTPYVVALVRLDEGVVMLSHIIDAAPEQIRCDQPVVLDFQPLRDGVSLPVFRIQQDVRA